MRRIAGISVAAICDAAGINYNSMLARLKRRRDGHSARELDETEQSAIAALLGRLGALID